MTRMHSRSKLRAMQPRWRLTLAIASAAVVATAIAFSARAAETVPSTAGAVSVEQNAGELEAVFWFCDYSATRLGFDPRMAARCSLATEELRRTKFGGSFERMLAWWRINKVAEHDRVEARRAALM